MSMPSFSPAKIEFKLVGSWTHAGDVASVPFTDLGDYRELMVVCRGLVCSVSSVLWLRASIDNGSTFLTTSGDYKLMTAAGAENVNTAMPFTTPATTSAQSSVVRVYNPPDAIFRTFEMIARSIIGIVETTSVVNAVQVSPSAGGNFTAGNINVFGRRG